MTLKSAWGRMEGAAAPARPASKLALTLLLSCTALVVPSLALAQSAGDTGTTVTLEPITVRSEDDDSTTIVATEASSGSKTDTDILDTAGSVSVVTSKEIEKRKAQNLEQVIAYTSGVMVNEWGSDDRYDGFRIRGFDELSMGTYRDGLPVRGQGWTFGRREPYAYDRVEVLKGSNSSLFGMNAPGGLVNAVTKTPKSYKFGEIYTTVGPDHAEIGADFGDVIGTDWSYRVTTKLQDGAYSYDYSNDDRAFLALAATWRPTDATELTFSVDYLKRDGVPGVGFPEGAGIDRDTFLGEPDFNRFDTIEKSAGWMFRHDFGNGLTFRQNARYTQMSLTYEQVYGATTDATADRSSFAVYSDSEQFAIDNQFQYDTTFGNVASKTLFGLEYTWLKVDEEALFGTADGIDIYNIAYCGRSCVTLYDYIDWVPEQETKSIYLQEELTFGRWIATIGGRYDFADVDIYYPGTDTTTGRDFDAFTKRFGLTYKATQEVSLYANYSESFEPNVWDITADAKEGQQYEVGVKYRPDNLNAMFTAAIFDLSQTNVNTYVTATEQRQIGEVNVRGLELEGKMELNNRLNLTVAYSYWDSEIVEDGIATNEGNRPSRVPEHIASIWADYTVPGAGDRGDMTFGLGVRYVGQTYGDDANAVSVPSYTVVDAAFGYDLAKNVSLAVNVTNLMDEDYITTNYYGSLYYGDGRAVSATLKYTW